MALNCIANNNKYGVKRVMFEDCDYNDIVVARVSEDTFRVTAYDDDTSEDIIEEYVSKENFIKSITRMLDALDVANEVYEAIENFESEEE